MKMRQGLAQQEIIFTTVAKVPLLALSHDTLLCVPLINGCLIGLAQRTNSESFLWNSFPMEAHLASQSVLFFSQI